MQRLITSVLPVYRPLVRIVSRGLLILSLIGLLLAVVKSPAQAGTISVTTLNDSGVGSLRNAISSAAAGDTINFKLSGTITLTSGQLTINKNLTIDGAGHAITVSGNNADRVICVPGNANLTINALTITHGKPSTFCNGDVSSGGGLYNNAGELTVTNSTFSGNNVFGYLGRGGGLFNFGAGTVNVTNSTFSGNNAINDLGHGGGLFNNGTGALNVTNSTFSGNTVFGHHADGGGIVTSLGKLTVTNSTFSGNSTTFDGGAIIVNGTLTVTNSTFTGNSSTGIGGAIFNDHSGTVTVTNSTFTGNSSTGTCCNEPAGFGGAISISPSKSLLIVTNSTFSGNSAANEGGGIFSSDGDTLNITNSTFSGNSATGSGGGIYSGTMTVTNSTFSGNSATGSAGGIGSFVGDTVKVKNTIITKSSGGNCSSAIMSINNLVDDATCGATLGAVTKLSPALANNGGLTKTFALLDGSNAIDGVPTGTCTNLNGGATITTDQRGTARPQGLRCDIGAYEFPIISLVPTGVHLPAIPIPVGATIPWSGLPIGECNGDLYVSGLPLYASGETFEPVTFDWLPIPGATSYVLAMGLAGQAAAPGKPVDPALSTDLGTPGIPFDVIASKVIPAQKTEGRLTPARADIDTALQTQGPLVMAVIARSQSTNICMLVRVFPSSKRPPIATRTPLPTATNAPNIMPPVHNNPPQPQPRSTVCVTNPVTGGQSCS